MLRTGSCAICSRVMTVSVRVTLPSATGVSAAVTTIACLNSSCPSATRPVSIAATRHADMAPGRNVIRLFKERLEPFLLLGNLRVRAHQQPRAGVPAQERIVVPRWPDGLGRLVAHHGLPKALMRHRAGAVSTDTKMRLALALPDDPTEICALVLTDET